jgi:hypothetical protein
MSEGNKNSLDFKDMQGGLDPQDLYFFITPDTLNQIELDPEVPDYDGEGITSYKSDHDPSKKEYMERLGVRIPEDWERAYLVNAFIILNGIIGYKRAKEDDVSESLYYSYIMKKWLKHRIDEDGDRSKAKPDSDKRLGDYTPGSINPTLKLRPDEFLIVFNHVHDELYLYPNSH